MLISRLHFAILVSVAVLSESRSCPWLSAAYNSLLVRSYHGGTSPKDISLSDGHSLVKVLVRIGQLTF